MGFHDVIWAQPPALGASTAARLLPMPREAFHTPAILRFDNDAFMPEFLALLETAPQRLIDYKVRRETWRGFTPNPLPEVIAPPSLVRQRLGILRRRTPAAAPASRPGIGTVPANTLLKLYQPAHQRHYLVVSSLVCKVAGLPDRVVDTGKGEQTGFVIRRLLPPAGNAAAALEAWHEHAWVATETGWVWRDLGADSERLVAGEERLNLFSVRFAEDERRRRRLFAGVIPVGKREAYLGAPRATGSGGTPGVTTRTARKVLLRKEVVEPWKTLLRRAQQVRPSFVGPFAGGDRAPSTTERRARLRIEREQIQTVSWLILLDFAKYLATYLKPVWRAVLNPALADGLTDPERNVLNALDQSQIAEPLRAILLRDAEVNATANNEIYPGGSVAVSLRDALAKFGAGSEGINVALEDQLDRIDVPYNRHDASSRAQWPSFLFPLADPDRPGDSPLPAQPTLGPLTTEEAGELTLDERSGVDDPLERVDMLAVLVLRALRDDDADPAPQPAVPAAAIAPANALEGWFVIRCVFEQPACEPLHTGVLSDPTDPFQMAGFFDPDAPARPIRIGLPIDTTPAGLRKFDKNTAFVISDTLCGQIQRLKGLTLGDLVLSVLPWPFHKDLPDLQSGSGPCKTAGGDSLGMICSLSIPIVTICALILLMIMVTLFDFIFRWMPFFIFCFPLPGLKAKKS
jgi:hypothetical protein